MHLPILIPLFFLVALIYSIAGFGGGSSYLALLFLFDAPNEIIAPLGLACNIIVTGVGSFWFIKAKLFTARLILPFVVASIPLAYIGGRIPIAKTPFLALLGISLFCAAIAMLLPQRGDAPDAARLDPRKVWRIGLPLGGALGLLSGLVGIGGGIFLSPLLSLMRWGNAKQIAATCSVFILLNSIAGLFGQLSKPDTLSAAQDFVWLPLAVLAGGAIGGFLGSHKFSIAWVRKVSAIIVLYVALRIFLQLFGIKMI
jgi:uncharacterized membrane protein YfcA